MAPSKENIDFHIVSDFLLHRMNAFKAQEPRNPDDELRSQELAGKLEPWQIEKLAKKINLLEDEFHVIYCLLKEWLEF